MLLVINIPGCHGKIPPRKNSDECDERFQHSTNVLHQNTEGLVPHQRLLGLQLLVHKLLQGHAVHRVLKGQLGEEGEEREWERQTTASDTNRGLRATGTRTEPPGSVTCELKYSK